MKLVFDDDRGYEAFQFIWIGLMKTRLPKDTLQRAVTAHNLLARLARISKPDGAGRILKRECEFELSTDEQLFALEAIAQTSWKPEVFPHVRKACEFLGAEFSEAQRA
jgi:hypothetical protein